MREVLTELLEVTQDICRQRRPTPTRTRLRKTTTRPGAAARCPDQDHAQVCLMTSSIQQQRRGQPQHLLAYTGGDWGATLMFRSPAALTPLRAGDLSLDVRTAR